MGFIFFYLVFVGEIFYCFFFCFFVFFYYFVEFFFLFCFVLFLVQHNLEHLKAFQPKCGGKTGKALFLHKTSIPNSANESGAS